MYVSKFRKANFEGLKKALSTLVVKGNTTDQKWNRFKEQIKNQQIQYIPLRNKNVTNAKDMDWFNANIAQAIRNRNRLYKLKKNNTNPSTTSQYINARREVKKEIRQSKRDYEIKIANASKNDPKSFYRYINNRKQLKSGIGPLLSEQGDTITDDKEMATMLNDYFCMFFTKVQETI